MTFTRLPDHQRGAALIERDDGVGYWLDGGPITAALSHDLVHFTVERALGMSDGIWGAIAAGVVFRSMRHHSGRRPPHAAQRSAALLRANRASLLRAELLGGFVERVAALPQEPRPPAAVHIAQLAKTYLANLPGGEVDLQRVAAAAVDVQQMGRRWRALSVGAELSVEWKAWLRLPTDRRHMPRGQECNAVESCRLVQTLAACRQMSRISGGATGPAISS